MAMGEVSLDDSINFNDGTASMAQLDAEWK